RRGCSGQGMGTVPRRARVDGVLKTKPSSGSRSARRGSHEESTVTKIINPNLEWYAEESTRRGLPTPRCPFASVHRCPRYWQSLSVLGGAVSTKIEPDKDEELLERWRTSDLWPATREQATSMGPEGDPHIFSNFCPEVAFER